MTIISFNYIIDHAHVHQSSLFSHETLLDADVVLWDLDRSLNNIQVGNYKLGGRKVSGTLKEHFEPVQDLLKYRKEQFEEFFSLGRTLVVQVPINPIREYNILDMESNTSEKKKVNLWNLIPISPVQLVNESGQNVSLSENELLQQFKLNNRLIFKYNARFKNAKGLPLLYINKTDYVVAQLFPLERGNVLMLPALLNNNHHTYSKFYEALEQLVENLPKTNIISDLSLPQWSKTYSLKGEELEKQKAAKLNDQLEKLNKKISLQNKKVEFFERLKILFTGTGKSLEVVVKQIFEELGFAIYPTLPNRGDLIVGYKSRNGVLEIKGVKGGAAEKNATQLEKWVSEYIDEHGKEPKAILLINTFKDLPLDERTDKDFPDQMLPYCKKREHCLLTGLTFLNLYLDYKFGQLSKSELIKLIFDTIGILKYEKGGIKKNAP